MTFPLRYLVRFGPKQTTHVFTDLLVIGGGIAGLRAALAAPPAMQVLVVTKDRVQQSNSSYAQGGIAAVTSPEDRFENHIEDTLTAGAGLCDRDVVERVVREAPDSIDDLIRYGAHFDASIGMEGGHSHRRIVHALGDATGWEVMRAVIDRARKAANVAIWDRTFTIDLLTHDGRCVGALVRRGRARPPAPLGQADDPGQRRGRHGLPRDDQPAGGDRRRHGGRLPGRRRARDMEFMQFHPTILYVAGSSRTLISEAVRGEGAYLRDKNGVRFMLEEDPRHELAMRDVVARAIVRRMEKTQHPNVYLDLSHLDSAKVREHFPGIDKVCREFGLDITTDLIPVRPGAHYMVGGVTVDLSGRTTLPGLWAAGEVSSSGLHGANRLASNSLLEGLVFGAACGRGRGGGGGADAGRVRGAAGAERLHPRQRRPAARRGRPDQRAAQPDGAQHGHRPRPIRAAGSGKASGVLVPLRVAARVLDAGGMGAAEPADGGAPDDLVGADSAPSRAASTTGPISPSATTPTGRSTSSARRSCNFSASSRRKPAGALHGTYGAYRTYASHGTHQPAHAGRSPL